jgi:hypothetical protein
MRRAHLLLPAALLSCAPAAEDSGAAAPPPGWLETVEARISAHARAIVPEGPGYAAALPGHPAVARFTGEGLILGEPGAAHPLELRFTAWGSAGAAQAVEPVAPTLGDCLTELLPEGGCARQLEYAHAGVTAWWVGLDRGVEFGWTVAAPPAAGGGELVFEVEVSGADWLGPAGEGAELVDASGEGWTVSGALAWGADGAPLPASLEVDGEALVVRVDAEGAAYPVTVDPVLSAATTTVVGATHGAGLGLSVAGAGDVNGDGYDDVIIGARDYTGGAIGLPGAAYVHHGSAGGVSATASLSLFGAAAGDSLGRSVAGAGDVNGDGYDDVVIGAHLADVGSTPDIGVVNVHHGSASGLSATADLQLVGGYAGDWFGYAVAAAGDVDGDGYADVIVGAPGRDGYQGAVQIFHGSPGGLLPSPVRTLLGTATSDFFGGAVAGAGDVNGDGYDDVIAGAFGYGTGPGTDPGGAFVYHGSGTGVAATAARTFEGTVRGGYFGWSVAGAGDVNGDGYADIIIGAFYDGASAYTLEGAAYVHHGSAAGLGASADRVITGASPADFLGSAVAAAGDVNGDGYGDVLIGAQGYDSGALAEAGAVHLHEGSAGGLSTSPTVTLPGAAVTAYFGTAVAGAGDVNGDGFADLVLGCYNLASGALSTAGAAYVHLGYRDGDEDGVVVGGEAGAPQDCDDDDPAVGAPSLQHVDADGDGFGGAATVTACPGDAGTAATATDCDDARAHVNPGAPEVCGAEATDEATDEDCDGAVDDDDPSLDPGTRSTFYADADGDGFGDPDRATEACAAPAGTVAAGGDCNDTRADVHPDAPEVCDPADADENCNGFADDGDGTVDPASRTAWYADADGDGFGDASSEYFACASATGVPNGLDCDDGRADVNPSATELPGDGLDQDCDGADGDAGADGGAAGDSGGGDADEGGGKSGCSAAPSAPWSGLGALLLLPALWRRRRRG